MKRVVRMGDEPNHRTKLVLCAYAEKEQTNFGVYIAKIERRVFWRDINIKGEHREKHWKQAYREEQREKNRERKYLYLCQGRGMFV